MIAEIGKSQRLRIVNRLKRTQGLSVGQLSEALGMSYMGVKQHCLDLEQRGYLDTWRRPKPVGRPELIYRLTQKANDLFPAEKNELSLELLQTAQALYGSSAPEKLLFFTYQKRAEGYAARIKGESLEERARWLAKQRDSEGYMAEFTDEPSHENAPGSASGIHSEPSAARSVMPVVERHARLVEHHSPILGLLAAYPQLMHRLEEELFSKVLRTRVRREQTSASGLYSCVFWLQS